jgi:SAM-dependent methyltransferase/uncharacterized protein YbaR (Trm112 family)
MPTNVDPWFLDNLVCPIEKSPLTWNGSELASPAGRRYPVIDGVPVMLPEEAEATIGLAEASLKRAQGKPGSVDGRAPHLYLESLGISEDEKQRVLELAATTGLKVDPVAACLVAATNGIAYIHLIGSLQDYPIPELRLPEGGKRRFLDVGCSWGRWSIAAAQKGYQAVGLDPSLGAVMAARRVARQLGLPNLHLVGDARFLPFRSGSVDTFFSYSVLQHFSRENARLALSEAGRVLAEGGESLVQMPNFLGIRCLQHQLARRFREPSGFEVRYWSVAELRNAFAKCIGRTSVEVDCFFGLGLQKTDLEQMTGLMRAAIHVSEFLRRISRHFPLLTQVADSVYLRSVKGSA